MKRFRVCAVVTVAVLLGLPGAANAKFDPAGTYAVGDRPSSVAVGDLNGDTKNDLVIANFGSNDVTVLLGNGNGTFASAVNYGVGLAPGSVAITDFNADTKPDLAVTNYGSNTVSVLVGNGNGTFATAVSYATGVQPWAIALGWFNADAMPDLAVAYIGAGASPDYGGVSVLLGNGDATFAAATNYSVPYGPTSVAVGDFNSDSKADLAVAKYPGVAILNGNGDGTFASAGDLGSFGAGRHVVVGDLDGDARPDLVVVVANPTPYGAPNAVTVSKGNGDGTFTYAALVPINVGITALAIGDLNHDAEPDVAMTTGSGVVVLLGDGSGALPTQVTYPAGAAPSSVAIGTFSSDARPDLAVANGSDDTVSVLVYTPAPEIIGVPPAFAPRNLTFNYQFALTGEPTPTTSVTSGALPPGITLSPSGVLSGTPTTEGSYTATVTATNGVAPDAATIVTIEIYLFSITPNAGPKGTAVSLRAAELPPGDTVKFFYKTGLASPRKVKLCDEVVAANGTASSWCISSFERGGNVYRIPSDGTQGPKGPHTIVAKAFPSLVKHKTIFTRT